MIDSLLQRLDGIEAVLGRLVQERVKKEFYTTAEVAKLIGRSEYTVREWCRKGQVQAEKAPNGRSWLVRHEELDDLRNRGPHPEQEVHRGLERGRSKV